MFSKAKKIEDQKPEEKKAESKKNARAAEKMAKKNKIRKAAKAVADKAIIEIAAALPGAGQGKALLQITATIDKIDEQIAALNLAKRGERAKLKEMKIELRVYDHVRKLRKMEPEDAKSFKATQALYEDQLGLALSPQQKKLVEDINVKREEARVAMMDSNGGDTGKEVGSAAGTMPKGARDGEEEESIPGKPSEPLIPARNVNMGAFKAASSAIN